MIAMKRKLAAALVAAALVSAGTAAQGRKLSEADKKGVRARGLFVKKAADGIRVRVLTKDGSIVAPERQFKSGDELKIEIQSNFDGYVYVINVEEGGKRYLLFPHVGQTDNRIGSDTTHTLPREANYIVFDERPGLEILQVIMSHDPISSLDAALRSPACADSKLIRCELERSASTEPATTPGGAKNPNRGGIVAGNTEQVLPGEAGGIRARGITFGAGKDKAEGSFVTVVDKNGKGAKLASGQLSVFEMRLRHN